MEEEYYNQWLCSLVGMTNQAILRAVDSFGSAKAVYEASAEMLETVFTPFQKNVVMESKKRFSSPEILHRSYEQLQEKKIRFVSRFHPQFPKRLLEIPDIPMGLYYKGELPGEASLSVAIIGARECSAYGELVARELGQFLGKKGVSVISGMARGVDGISQRGALAAGGKSYGVLGSGVDVCYPQSNRSLYDQLESRGGLISAYPPGTKPLARNFPARNRIVSGLSDVVVVVEARAKSGTLITVDMALEQGKEVFVVPGRVTDGLSEGCNRLMKQGAGIVVSYEDFFEEICSLKRQTNPDRENLNEKLRKELRKLEQVPKEKLPDIPEELFEIYEKLDWMPKTLETIQGEMGTGITMTEVQVMLMRLCMYGVASQVSPGAFRRV